MTITLSKLSLPFQAQSTAIILSLNIYEKCIGENLIPCSIFSFRFPFVLFKEQFDTSSGFVGHNDLILFDKRYSKTLLLSEIAYDAL